MEKKNDKIVLAIILVTITVLGYLIYFNIKKNNQIEINATIKEIGNNYIIVVTEQNEEYLLNTKKEYNVGDKINVVLKNIKKDSPNKGEIVTIETISKNVEFSITDIKEETKENESHNTNIQNNNPSENNEITPQHQEVNTPATEEEIVSYFTTFKQETDNTTTLKDTIKEKFVIVVDFLFYDGQIKGKTFKELSNSAKLKVIKIFLTIDNKLESKFPNYKETISNTGNKIYTNVKNKALELYFNITTEVCNNNQELCEEAKKGLTELKSSFSLTWDFIKEMAGTGLNKAKNWYELWREA